MPLGRNRQARGMFRRRHRPSHWMALVLLCLWSTCWTAFGGPGYHDPYKVLGISRRASKSEIQKSYRKLCLQYHPDKNVQKTEDEQLLSETKFKMVRDAYEAILHKRGIYAGTGAKATATETFVRPFQNILFVLRRPGLFWSEMKRLNLFATGSPYATVGERNPGEIDVRSTYYQTVKVPLEELYQGIPIFPLELKDNIFRRYWASLRGSYLFYSLYQASCIFFPLFRSNKIIAYLVGLYIVHGTTPIPDPKATYATSLQKGTWAGVRTVVFSKWRELQVVFRLQEADHPIYRRVGTDLHAQVTLTRREARRGCIKRLPPLDPAEPPIPIMISPNTYSYEKEEYSKDYQKKAQEMQSKGTTGRQEQEERPNLCPYDNTIRIPGRGWPRRIPKSTKYQRDMYRYGDLIVTINVEKPSPDEDTIIHSFPFRA